MPATFALADVLDHGLTVVPHVLDDIDASPKAIDVVALVKEALIKATPDRVIKIDPTIITDPATLAAVMINSKHTALGGAGGFLGTASGPVTPCPDGVGSFRHFAGGSIYWHPAAGVHEVHGAIRAKWAALGWERGFLGYPTSDERPGADPGQRGRFSAFQGGMVLWTPPLVVDAPLRGLDAISVKPAIFASASVRASDALASDLTARLTAASRPIVAGDKPILVAQPPKTIAIGGGAFEVHGAIGEHFRTLGASASFLGYPTTDETPTPDGIGRYNHFESGSIYWTPRTGAHEVHGLIRALWAQSGWERNPALGYPISDELIPDRAAGHRRPEILRKPFAIPIDVVRLPSAAAGNGFSPTVANLKASDVIRLGTSISPLALATASAKPSRNRFGDFENGVLFWRRGAPAAEVLAPWGATAGGQSIRRSAAQVIAALEPSLRTALSHAGTLSAAPFAFAGTTTTTFDGVGARNRRQRTTVAVKPSGFLGLFGTELPVELQIEVAYEPASRRVTACLADWGASDVLRAAGQLDPLLYRAVELFRVPEADGGRDITVLTVKTLPDGSVAVYIEPVTSEEDH